MAESLARIHGLGSGHDCPLCDLHGRFISEHSLERHIAVCHGIIYMWHDLRIYPRFAYKCLVCDASIEGRKYAIQHFMSTPGHIKTIIVQELLKK